MFSKIKYSVVGKIFDNAEGAIIEAAKLVKVLKPSNDLETGTYIKGPPGWYMIGGEKQYYDGKTLWKKVK